MARVFSPIAALQKLDVALDRKNVHISLDNVPAWVCTQCGEVYFEEAEVDAVQGVIRAVDEQAEKLAHTA
ncbi:MAG TPA: YgiT-type zinc finger protein [Gammaproteobacteria bacterium]|nr:YgiT-type zinc finger protein [Gammaproteobacteria bacterium]